jgi:4-hydroxy-tetrahydrodipicolinate synthase
LELTPFFKVIFLTTNPIPVKTAVNLIGHNAGPFRLPMVPPTAEELEQIKKVMSNIGIQ